jgi:cytidine deaminase
LNKNIEKLMEKAKKVRKNAYAPYSGFKVGSAVLTNDGKIFTGCNIENASFGLSVCAERIALFKAISMGYKDFQAIAIICNSEKPCTPCGACRQVMIEFSPEMDVIMCNLHSKIIIKKAKQLIPDAFEY